jgi:16S rRNA G527 N7-methylase RsmG
MVASVGEVALSRQVENYHILLTRALANLQEMLELRYRLTEMLF